MEEVAMSCCPPAAANVSLNKTWYSQTKERKKVEYMELLVLSHFSLLIFY